MAFGPFRHWVWCGQLLSSCSTVGLASLCPWLRLCADAAPDDIALSIVDVQEGFPL